MNIIEDILLNFSLCQKSETKIVINNKLKHFEEIILIGPMGVGKTTVGKLLSKQLKMPHCSLDDVCLKFYDEIGYDNQEGERIGKEKGLMGEYEYRKPFEAYAVKRALETYKGYIIDFGGGHSVYEDDNLFNEIKQILEPYKNVILLLPSEDINESLKLFEKRCMNILNKHFLTHHSNKDLAKMIVYTKGKTPKETAFEIKKLIIQNRKTNEKAKDTYSFMF